MNTIQILIIFIPIVILVVLLIEYGNQLVIKNLIMPKYLFVLAFFSIVTLGTLATILTLELNDRRKHDPSTPVYEPVHEQLYKLKQ